MTDDNFKGDLKTLGYRLRWIDAYLKDAQAHHTELLFFDSIKVEKLLSHKAQLYGLLMRMGDEISRCIMQLNQEDG